MNKKTIYLILTTLVFFSCVSCGVYTFRDVSIPPEVKTIKVFYIQNKAQYVNPQLSPKLTEAFNKKIIQQTKIRRIEDASADYVVEAEISNYMVTTAGVSQNEAATNRISVAMHIILNDNFKNEVKEYDISRDFDFPASQSFTQAEARLQDEMIKVLSDEMFNKLFSNW